MKRPDKKYYIIHKFCLNCFAKFEDNLRNKGSYKDYYNKINNQIIDKLIYSFINDLIINFIIIIFI